MRSWANSDEKEPEEFQENVIFKSGVRAIAEAAGIKDPVKLVAIQEAAFTAAAGIVIDRSGIVGTIQGSDASAEPTRSEQALLKLQDRLTKNGITDQNTRKKIADFATEKCKSIRF